MSPFVSLAAGLLAVLPLVSGYCDNLSVHFHTELGCSPVYSGDPSCPSRFDCGGLEHNRRNYCVVKSLVTDKGGKVELNTGISNPCVPSCQCTESYDRTVTRYRWQCTHNECPRYFHPKPHPGCFLEEELMSCCPSRMVCKNNLAKCVYNGVTYKENNRFYAFRGATCVKCLCTPSFNGTLMEPWCTKIGCDLELHGGEHLAKGCAPIYSKNFCCPIDWRCPDPEDAVRQADPRGIATSEGAGQCKFGDLLLNVGESVLPDLEANCRCNIPPYVVCTSS